MGPEEPEEALVALQEAIDHVAFAKACIAQNVGPDKEDARASYDACVADELAPAMYAAFEDFVERASNAEIVRFAKQLLRASVKAKGP